MTSRLAAAREALALGLVNVLPGRVDAYPPAGNKVVAPRVWIADVTTIPSTIGTATTVLLATFPVCVIYDGAVHAQVAGIDDVVSSVLDAVAATPGFESDGSRPMPVAALVPGVGSDSTLRAHVVTATTTISARTLCPPSVTPAVVPPVPVTAQGGRHA